MNNEIIMNDKAKRNLGLISFLPAICFGSSFVYYLITLYPIMKMRLFQDGIAVATSTAHNYLAFFIVLAISATVSAAVLIYFMVHLARIKTLNTPTKMLWALVLVSFVPFSFIMFYFMELRREPEHVPAYTEVA